MRNDLLRIARQLLSAKQSYNVLRSGKGGIIYAANKVRFFIEQIGSDSYYLARFRTVPAMNKKLLSINSEQASVFFTKYVNTVYSEDFIRRAWLDSSFRKDLLRTVKFFRPERDLISYGKRYLDNMDGFVRDVVLESTLKLNLNGLYDYLVVRNDILPAVFFDIVGKLPEEKSDETDVLKIGRWVVRYDIKAPSMNVGNIENLLKAVESKLSSKGLRKLCYGDVLLVKTLSGKRVADYVGSSDSIRLKVGGRASKLFLESFIHELGHRFLDKFASSSFKSEVNRKFYSFGSVTARKIGVDIGDKIIETNPRGGQAVWKVLRDLGDKIEILLLESSDKRMKVGRRYTIKPKFLLSNKYDLEGKFKKEIDESSYYVSSYALHSAEEFFCELFSNWVLGKLKSEAKEWFDNLMK